LTVVDTAGLRDTVDVVEQLGIARTRAAIARADVALLIMDARDAAGETRSRRSPRAAGDAAARRRPQQM
jgi:tRNA modification GTPase